MSAITKSVGVAAVVALTALVGAVSATSGASTANIKPLHAVSVHVGSKHAVGYFEMDNGVCQLTLVVGDELKGDELSTSAPARFKAKIESGSYARFDTGEGRQLQFSCASGATAMTVETLEQVAYKAPRT